MDDAQRLHIVLIRRVGHVGRESLDVLTVVNQPTNRHARARVDGFITGQTLPTGGWLPAVQPLHKHELTLVHAPQSSIG
jgi:hypothetical protein